ncbi:alanine racemase, partial [Methylobacterium sp. WL18]|uniref:alanine racemase n=1 Tax=Methylobacterium sp. WL18 TaxID=2603897 RepID=UPI0032B15FDB
MQAFDDGGRPHAGAMLTVDLDAIAANYRLLSRRLGTAECAAVLKADAYGLGAARVAPILSAAGCRTFFVAHLDEGIALRRYVPRGAAVRILHGAPRGAEAECLEHGLVPVLNTPGQLAQGDRLKGMDFGVAFCVIHRGPRSGEASDVRQGTGGAFFGVGR